MNSTTLCIPHPVCWRHLTSIGDDVRECNGEKGFVRDEVDADMITGFFLDLNQNQFAPWIKRNYGTANDVYQLGLE